jgi:matrix metalloproteinase-14 (membrane-inserted)
MSLIKALGSLISKANQNPEKAGALVDYLVHFGYINPQDTSVEEVLTSVKRFKDIFSINEEGIGPKTLAAIELPRCGCKEYLIENASNPNKWGLKNLTYFIKSRDGDLLATEWDQGIRTAFDNWSEVVPLIFTKVDKSSEANIILDTSSSKADDFDGPSGVLAWCQLPPTPNYKGQILCKFDLSETWVLNNPNQGILLVNVACHELGHGLGLVHSNQNSALMAPYYSTSKAKPQKVDDIPRIQALYGTVNTPTPTPTPVPTPTPEPTSDLVINIKGNITSINIPGYRVTKQG